MNLEITRPLTVGQHVVRIQRIVGARPDGWYGPKTAQAVNRWRTSRGLPNSFVWDVECERLVDTIDVITARNYTPANRKPGDGSVRFITIHTIQCPCKPRYARSNAEWFAGPNAPNASVHYWVGPDETILGLDPKHLAWGAKSGPLRHAQHHAIHIEHTGFTEDKSRGLVATDYTTGLGLDTIKRSARLAAELCVEWGVPVTKGDLDAFAYAKRTGLSGLGLGGFVGHVDWTRAYGVRGGNVDPGNKWPWELYLDLVRCYVQDALLE